MAYDYDHREAARLGDLEKPAQDVVNMARDLYRLIGRMESTAKRLKAVHPKLSGHILAKLPDLDRKARQLSTDIDEKLGID